jgi:Tfp pilus assembly protein PilV
MKDKEEKKEDKKNSWAEELEKRKKLERQKEQERLNRNQGNFGSRGINKKQFTRNRRSTQGGGSTLEILVAFVVITLAITGVMMVVFGNQSFALDTKLTQRALYHAERGIEMAYASSTNDFSSLASAILPLFGTEDMVYGNQAEVDIVDISPCVKMASSTVLWQTSPINSRQAILSSIFVSTTTSAAMGGDCDTTGLSDPWDNPGTYDSVDLNPSGNKGTDIDVVTVGGIRYVFLTSETGAFGKPDFWSIDASDPQNLGTPVGLNVGASLNALDVAGNYAYVASQDPNQQFQIIDISDPINPSLVATSTLNNVDPLGSYPEAISIKYLNHRVYVGTAETATDEFHIFDVSNPAAPVELGSINLFHNVHDIEVFGSYAYLATSDNSGEIMVLDISDPTNLTHPDISGMKFNAPGNSDGTSIYMLSGTIYLGRETAGSDGEIYVVDASLVRDSSSTSDGALGFKDLDLNPNNEVSGIITKSNLMFLATTDQTKGFQVWDISDPANIQGPSTCNTYNYSEKASGIDFSGDFGFVVNESNDALRVIYDTPAACS